MSGSHRTNLWAHLAAVATAMLSAVGCTANIEPYVTPERLDRGLVVILTGIEGPSYLNASIREGLMQSELPYAVEIYNWVGLRPGASYAYDQAACYRKAEQVVGRIEDYRSQYPGRPVFLIGHSGGGAIAVFAAEVIDADRPLTGLITLAPALNPHYDLSAALVGCQMRMVNCFTETDVLLKSLTSVYQNLDGVSGPTAGHDGFALPPGATRPQQELYSHLRQIRWDRSMRKEGNFGGHTGWTRPKWVARHLAPIITEWALADAEPDPATAYGGPRPSLARTP